MPSVDRRPLAFRSLADVMPEVDRLLLGGYTPSGRWSLGQICQHLARTMQSSLEGEAGRFPRIFRRTIGAFIARRVIARGRMPEGIPLPRSGALTPQDGPEDRAEAEALRGAIRYFAGLPDTPIEHPVFGPLSRHQFEQLQCIHCAHHLSFLRPTPPGRSGDV
ncbi:DUF1569 domain-containing protein [Aquisphaera insulae]|uniref:DUF1569 domain-containing protein n=1 Tax=Aquisphaera insulae TaxID=2712864 RepID=UPI0013EA1FE8|nr:DUF1569 domain-containing protein [Aquisphaera insulae]